MRGSQFRYLICLFLPLLLCLPRASFCADDNFLLLTAASRAAPTTAQAWIGTQGGTISIGILSLSIPAGALDQRYLVVLEKTAADDAYPIDAHPHAFSLDLGGGANALPITVTIRGFGGEDREMSIALTDSLREGTNVESPAPARIINGAVTGGSLSFDIPAMESQAADVMSGVARPQNGTAGIGAIYAAQVLSPRTRRVNGLFVVNYPPAMDVDPILNQILAIANDAADKLEALGFVFRANLNLPVGINIVDNMGQRSGEAAIPLSGKANAYINLNRSICATAQLEELKVTIGHEFFHIVQNTYDPRNGIRIRHPWTKASFYWLSDACSVWFENRMLGSSTYVSPVFTSNIDMHRYGLETYTDHQGAMERGYGVSGFLRRLVDSGGGEMLPARIWERVRAQGADEADYSDLRAVLQAVATPEVLPQSWRDFEQRLLTGNTGYANWPIPGSNTSIFVSGDSARETTVTIEPFSSAKVSFFLKNSALAQFKLSVTQANDVAYAVSKGSDVNQPASFVDWITPDRPLYFKSKDGEFYTVSVINSSTAPPYTAAASVTVRLEPNATLPCQECPDVPNNARYTSDTYVGRWKHPTLDYEIAVIWYYDVAKTQLNGVRCMWLDSGNIKKDSSYFESGDLWMTSDYDEAGFPHGQFYSYHQNGNLAWTVNQVHGSLDGVSYKYHENGVINQIETYALGVKNGIELLYDENGVCLAHNEWVNGSLVSSPPCP